MLAPEVNLCTWTTENSTPNQQGLGWAVNFKSVQMKQGNPVSPPWAFCAQLPAFNSLETEESSAPKYPYIILQGFDIYYVSHLGIQQAALLWKGKWKKDNSHFTKFNAYICVCGCLCVCRVWESKDKHSGLCSHRLGSTYKYICMTCSRN